jgi:oxalate decarboxylase
MAMAWQHIYCVLNRAVYMSLGISGALSAYSNEVLAAVLNLDSTLFDKLPKLEEDVFVVTGGA